MGFDPELVANTLRPLHRNSIVTVNHFFCHHRCFRSASRPYILAAFKLLLVAQNSHLELGGIHFCCQGTRRMEHAFQNWFLVCLHCISARRCCSLSRDCKCSSKTDRGGALTFLSMDLARANMWWTSHLSARNGVHMSTWLAYGVRWDYIAVFILN